jgi:hypothetical protein
MRQKGRIVKCERRRSDFLDLSQPTGFRTGGLEANQIESEIDVHPNRGGSWFRRSQVVNFVPHAYGVRLASLLSELLNTSWVIIWKLLITKELGTCHDGESQIKNHPSKLANDPTALFHPTTLVFTSFLGKRKRPFVKGKPEHIGERRKS